MHVDGMNTVYSATWSSTLTSDIIYNCSTVYLAILITVGVALNSRAMTLLIDFNKVRKLVFSGKNHLKFLTSHCCLDLNEYYFHYRPIKPNKH